MITNLIELAAQTLAFLTAALGMVLWIRSRRREEAPVATPAPAATDAELEIFYRTRSRQARHETVLAAAAQGGTTRALAERFGLSKATVHNILTSRNAR